MWDVLFYTEWLFLSLLGLTIGSFINVCIDRIPLQVFSASERKKFLETSTVSYQLKQYVEQKQLTIAYPSRSLCFACGHPLRWYENIPVASYFILKGQCSYCKRPYGTRTLMIELVNGLMYAVAFFLWPNLWISILLGVHFSLLCVVSILWIKHHLFLNAMCYLAVVLAIVDISVIAGYFWRSSLFTL